METFERLKISNSGCRTLSAGCLVVQFFSATRRHADQNGVGIFASANQILLAAIQFLHLARRPLDVSCLNWTPYSMPGQLQLFTHL